jgi:hypothetical protein
MVERKPSESNMQKIRVEFKDEVAQGESVLVYYMS